MILYAKSRCPSHHETTMVKKCNGSQHYYYYYKDYSSNSFHMLYNMTLRQLSTSSEIIKDVSIKINNMPYLQV